MGAYWAHKLPQYLDNWGIKYNLRPGWDTRSRSTGGFDNLLGVGIHHDASSTTTTDDGAFNWACKSSPDRPIGNGSLRRDGVFDFWCAGASNTQGRGGPRIGSRGVIPLDNGNRNVFSIEADNNGLGEVWTPIQCQVYPRLCAAVLDWANNETPGVPLGAGDVFAHFEWSPGRKFDPAGQSDWATGGAMWDMDAFRGSVYMQLASLAAAPTPSPEEDEMTPEQDQMLRTIFAAVQASAISDAVWKQAVPDGNDETKESSTWVQLVAGKGQATAANQAIAALRSELVAAGVLKA